MRILSATLLLYFVVSTYGATINKEATVELEAQIQSEIELIRTNSGILNILNRDSAEFKILSNKQSNVVVKFIANYEQDGYMSLKHDNENKYISYVVDFKGDKNLSVTNLKNNETVTVENDKFSDCEYSFQIIPHLKDGDSQSKYTAGNYKGTITIKISDA